MPTQRRRITVEEYHRLAAIGVLGERGVELLDGSIVYGKYPFAFAEEAARAAGIELTQPEQHTGAGSTARGSFAPSSALARTLAARGRPWSRSC